MQLCLLISYVLVGGEQRAVRVEVFSYLTLPTPDSSFDHFSNCFLPALADFGGDMRDQGAFIIRNPAGAEDAARNRRGDLGAISDQVLAAGQALLFGQKIEDDANGSQRILEESFR